MVVGELSDRSDVLVIGGGPGGYAAALRCAQGGLSVTLVERERIGGTCLNIGCIPSKILIHSADVAHLASVSSKLGVNLTADVDMVALNAHSADVVTQLTSGVGQLLDVAGVKVVHGEARFSRPRRVAIVNDELVSHHEFDHCIIATGSRPIELPGFGLEGSTIVDSTGALSLEAVPRSMVVIGAGYIGVELGTAWAKLGASVTVVETAPRILPELDKRLAAVVARRLKELGITVITNALARHAVDGAVTLEINGAEQRVDGEVVVVAVGRRPNTDELGLDVAGVSLDDRGFIEVAPDRRATSSILAIGDVTAGPALAHKATAEAEVAAQTVLGNPAAFDPAAIPAVVFSDPEVATIGMTLDAAAAQGIEASEFRFPFAAGSRSRTLDDILGFVQLVADESGTVIGGHAVGSGVSELASGLALAIEMAATVEDVAATIHPHPTMSEAIAEAAHGLLGHPLHVHR